VTNLANAPTRQASLYHFNFGYPALRPGSSVMLGSRQLFKVTALPDSSTVSESVSYPVDGEGAMAACRLVPPDDAGVPEITIAFGTPTLPHLQLWQDLRPHACVLAIEPCTSAKLNGHESVLSPGEARIYTVDVSFGQT